MAGINRTRGTDPQGRFMEKPDCHGEEQGTGGARAEDGAAAPSSPARSFSFPAPVASIEGIKVLPLSKTVRVLLPPLFISSLPRRAIGFSFPPGLEGRLVGSALLVGTAVLAYLLGSAFGVYAALGIVWLMGGTGVMILYNSTRCGVAFVKEMCSTCRLRPIIEEHEFMHLSGERSEEAVWRAAKKKYSYDGLGLGSDPMIHSFCPIAKRLKETP